MPNYPDIYIPASFKSISQSFPRVPLAPQEPSKPQKPNKPDWWIVFWVGFITAFLLVLLKLSFIISLISAFLLTFGTRLLQLFFYREELKKFNEYSKRYPLLNSKYRRAKQNWEEERKKILSPENIAIHRFQVLQQVLQDVYPPDGYNSKAPQGCCEQRLRRYIAQYLDGNIFSSTTLNIPNYSYPFSPDICYEKDKLYIDIEVDEPYYEKGGNLIPYHGYDEWKDSNRNKFFVDKEWIVIRFAEEQVARYPESCVKIIAQVISNVTGETMPQSLVNIPDLQEISRWTTDKAQQLIKDRYRETYIHLCR